MLMRGRRRVLFAGLSAVVATIATTTTTAVAAGRPPDAGPPGVRQALDDVVAAGVPGVVAYVRHGQQVWRLAAGVADRTTNRPARPDDRFRIGSNTKAFISTVLLQLEGEHRLSLDDTVDRWLPGLVSGNGNDGSKITVRQLLNHTSGLYNYTEDQRVFAPYLVHHDWDYVWSPGQLVSIALSHPPLFAPGSQWSYSNTNYILAGLIIQAVTHESPNAEVYQRILLPLGLRHTSFPELDPFVPDPHLDGYYLNYQDITFFSPSVAYAAGAIISTADDLARFHRALFAGRLLPQAQQRELETTIPLGPPGVGYGLGVLTEPVCGQPVWGHDGDFPGYASLSLTTADGSSQLAFAIDDDAITTPELATAEAELVQAALCPSSR